MNQDSTPLEQTGNTYFFPRTAEETMPVELDENTNFKYFGLEKVYNFYFPENSLSLAKESSKNEREQKRLNDSSFIYGEVSFRSVAYIIEYIKSEFGDQLKEGNFYDLGSGSGKGVIAAALIYPFKKCIGIELLNSLYTISEENRNKYEENIKKQFVDYSELFSGIDKPIPVMFKNEDFLKETWTEPSIILANSTCFSADLMNDLGKKANKECPSGTIIITFTKRIPGLSSDWELRDGFKRLMSWGIATVYIHRKK